MTFENKSLNGDVKDACIHNQNLAIDVAKCLPHGQNIRIIDKVVHFDPQKIAGQVLVGIKPDKPYMKGGRFSNYWFIEMMAQSVAAIFVLSHNHEDPKPQLGFLISIDDYELVDKREIFTSDELRVDIKMTSLFFPFAKYQCQISIDDILLAKAVMKFISNEKEEELLKGF